MNRQHIFGDAFFWVRFNFLQEGGVGGVGVVSQSRSSPDLNRKKGKIGEIGSGPSQSYLAAFTEHRTDNRW